MDRFKYTVEYFDEFDRVMKIDHGFVMAESYANAIDNIDNYYGKGNIEQIHLKPECDGNVIVLGENDEEFNTNWETPAKNFYC